MQPRIWSQCYRERVTHGKTRTTLDVNMQTSSNSGWWTPESSARTSTELCVTGVASVGNFTTNLGSPACGALITSMRLPTSTKMHIIITGTLQSPKGCLKLPAGNWNFKTCVLMTLTVNLSHLGLAFLEEQLAYNRVIAFVITRLWQFDICCHCTYSEMDHSWLLSWSFLTVASMQPMQPMQLVLFQVYTVYIEAHMCYGSNVWGKRVESWPAHATALIWLYKSTRNVS